MELLDLHGSEYLFYPAFPIDVAIIKGSIADRDGNISIEKEAIHIEQFEMAAAARNSGGIVMVQVDRIVDHGGIHPQMVTVPSTLVDYVIQGTPEIPGSILSRIRTSCRHGAAMRRYLSEISNRCHWILIRSYAAGHVWKSEPETS